VTHMTEQEYQTRMAQAAKMRGQSGRPGYYEGYMKGLRRLYQGPGVDSLLEHEAWIGMAYSRDKAGADRGQGYQHGLQGIKPIRY
jgi:hypothetical protein